MAQRNPLRGEGHGRPPLSRIGTGLARSAATLLSILLVVTPAEAQERHLEILAAKLRTELTLITDDVPGVMGVTVLDLTTGDRFDVNESLVFPQGSSIKIPILIELYRQADTGELRLDQRLPVAESDQAGGSGILQRFGDGTSELALRDLAVLMIVLSDNTATNMLIDQVGMENVNRTMRELGLPETKLQRMMIRPEQSARGNENLSTPAEAATLMSLLARCDLPMSDDGCADLRSILEIPKSGGFSDPIPPDMAVAWKQGGITGVATAWGIVDLPGRPYVVTAMVNYGDGEQSGEAIRRVAEASYAHFSRLAGATPYGTRVSLR